MKPKKLLVQLHKLRRLLVKSVKCQEGHIFLLDQIRFTLGYGSQNDLILKGYAEVCNLHAYIYKKGKFVIVENADAGGEVLVNYRLVDQQSVKKGDVIKIGTALLQYYEI